MPLTIGQFSDIAAGYVPPSGGGTTNFLRADGTWAAPAGGGGATVSSYVKLAEFDASASASINIPITAYAGYRDLVLIGQGIGPSVDASELYMRLNTNNGASDYAWNYTATALGTGVSSGDNADSEMQIAEAIESTAGNELYFEIYIHNPHNAERCNINWMAGYSLNSSGNVTQISGTGARLAAQVTTSLDFIMDTGNIARGKFSLFGIASTSDGTPDIFGQNKRFEASDDFISFPNVGASATTFMGGDLGLFGETATTGGAIIPAATDEGLTTHPGIAQLETGTTTTGRAAIRTDTNAFAAGGADLIFEAMINIEDLSTAGEEYDLRVGFGDSATADHTDGMYFEYDRNNNATDWNIVCAGAAARTRSDSNVVVAADAWIKLRIWHDVSAAEVHFYVNGVETAASPITGANIPAGFAERFGCGYWIIKSAGTTERIVFIDKMTVVVDMPSAR